MSHEVVIDVSYEPESLEPGSQEYVRLAAEAVRRTITSFAAEGTYEVSLMVTDDDGIRRLNAGYRGKDIPTDVLSFPMLEGEDGDDEAEMPVLLGDIVISIDTALRQAADFGHPVEREIAYLAVHGVLHLLGYDHEEEEGKEEMRKAEESVLAAIGQAR